MLEIKQSDDGKKGRFYIEVDGKAEAELAYVWVNPGKFIIDHTDVGEKLKGKSAGKQLVARAVEFARAGKINIIPLCPFAHAVFQKTPEYRDVL